MGGGRTSFRGQVLQANAIISDLDALGEAGKHGLAGGLLGGGRGEQERRLRLAMEEAGRGGRHSQSLASSARHGHGARTQRGRDRKSVV